jgi:hypothetical protein
MTFRPNHPPHSYVLRALDDLSLDLAPVNIGINGLVDLPTDHHIVAPNQVQTMLNLRARFGIVRGPDDALDCLREDEVRELVGREKPAQERTAVNRNDEDFLCLRETSRG